MTRSFRRRGLTLIELLVVVGIMVSLAVLMIPVLRPALEQRRIREAARVVNLALSTAHSQAIQTGRGHGVLFERNPNLPQACTTLRQVEVPPPYTGDITGAAVRILNATTNAGGPFVLKLKIRSGDFSNGVVRPGDRIRFNFQGPTFKIGPVNTSATDPEFMTPVAQDFPRDVNDYYQFDPPDATDGSTPRDNFIDNYVLTASIGVGELNDMPWSGTQWSMPVAFTIERQWVSSSAPPVVLPGQTAIDLCDSGCEGTGVGYDRVFKAYANDKSLPVVVLFSPSGSVKELHVGIVPAGVPPYRPFGPTYFLIGRRDRVSLDVPPAEPFTWTTPAEDGKFNIEDTNNLWVTVASQSGLVTTAPVDDGDARKTAREQERMGGN